MSSQELTAQIPARARTPRPPFEVSASALFFSLFLAGLVAGLPAAVPAVSSTATSYERLQHPLLIIALVQVAVVATVGRWRKVEDPYLLAKLLPLKLLSLFVFFNLKAWVPLVNPRLFDEAYQAVDVALRPVLELFVSVRTWVDSRTAWADLLYLLLYLIPFVVSPIVHALYESPRRLRQVVFGSILVTYLGGVSYYLAPALGPFVYREGLNPLASETQTLMLGMYREVQATGALPYAYFFRPLAAMPSLHVAHVLFFTLQARRVSPSLTFAYSLCLAWVVVECSVSAWHYLVDIPAGVAVALAATYLVRRFIPERPT